MKTPELSATLFRLNRSRLRELLPPQSLVVVNANDVPPTNADGTLVAVPNSDLFYLTGITQEQTILLLYPESHDPKLREILFIREPIPLLATWEGHKLSKAEARAKTGIENILWLEDFPRMFHRLICECDQVFLNTNEHKRAVIEVETREARFVADTLRRYPLHHYGRLARLMHQLRSVKSEVELNLMRHSVKVTGDSFARVLKFVKPGVQEHEVEAEYAHEFIRNRGRFAYPAIIASGANACVLHYVENNQPCRKGDMLLLDVGACVSNYNADLTRTIPVSGKFSKRQKDVYRSVLRVLRASIASLRPGLQILDWQKEAEAMMEQELLRLGLLTKGEVRRQKEESPAFRRYFMHGLGHPLGLDVHDVGITVKPMQAGWVMTVEPGIYIAEENMGIRLENNVLVTDQGPVDLTGDIPLEPEEIEAAMR